MLYFVILILAFKLGESHPIVNGTDGEENEFPYIVALRDRDNDQFCGGVIIDKNYILTVYHCVHYEHLKLMRVVAGTSSLVEADPKYTLGVERVFHFNNKKWLEASGKVYDSRHDLMILKLNGNIPISDKAKIVKLPETPPTAGTKVTFAGWGLTNSTKEPDPIQKIETVIQTSEICAYALKRFFSPYELCTFIKKVQGMCDGDSGTGLVKDGVLLGVALSADKECARGSPDYFANVYYYKDFIQKHLHEFDTIYRGQKTESDITDISDFFETEVELVLL